MGDRMKRIIFVLTFVIAATLVIDACAAPPLFKQRKYYGPIPFNTVSFSVGFVDGPSAEYLIEHFNWWAVERHGYDEWEDFTTSPFARVGYERQMSPNHFFRTSVSFGYIKGKSQGEYVASVTQADTLANVALDIERELAVYLFQLEAGFSYYFISPEPRNFSPYVGVGFSAVIPVVRLNTDSYSGGSPFSNPAETISRESLEVGFHGELGMIYYITNRYSAAMEGRIQQAQSEFYIHNANFDIDYGGFTLTLNLNYHF
jgi:hypothetical protein